LEKANNNRNQEDIKSQFFAFFEDKLHQIYKIDKIKVKQNNQNDSNNEIRYYLA